MTVIFTAKDIDDIGAEVEETVDSLAKSRGDGCFFVGNYRGKIEEITEFGLHFAAEVSCFNNFALSKIGAVSFQPGCITIEDNGEYESGIFILLKRPSRRFNHRPVKDPQ